MASTVVEIMPSTERKLATVSDDGQHMSVDELCLSVTSISLTDSSALEKVTKQLVMDEHRAVASADRAEDEARGIDIQLRKLDGKLDIGPVTIIPLQHQTKEAFVTGSAKDEKEEMEDWKISQDSRTENERAEVELLGRRIKQEDGPESAEHTEDVTRLTKPRQCIPQEHDETTEKVDGIVVERGPHGIAGRIPELDKIVARGPQGGIPVPPRYGQSVLQPGCLQMYPQYGGFADWTENPPKYRRPPPEYGPPATYPPAITMPPLMNGGNVIVQRPVFNFGDTADCFVGHEPSQMQPVPPVINLEYDEMNKVIDDFLQNQVPVTNCCIASGDFDGIMNSANGDENPPVVPTEIPPVTRTGIPVYPEIGFTGSPMAVSVRADASPKSDEYSECLSPGSTWSPEIRSAMSPSECMSPGCAWSPDSGLADDLDTVLDVITNDLKENHQRHASGEEFHATGNPHFVEIPGDGNPRRRNPSFETSSPGNPAPNPTEGRGCPIQMGIPTVVQQSACTVPSVITNTPSAVYHVPVTCIFVPTVPGPPIQASPTPRYREIRPRPPDVAQNSRGAPDSRNPGLLITFM